MRILLTGYTGKIGKSLLTVLLKIDNVEIICLGRTKPFQLNTLSSISWFFWDASMHCGCFPELNVDVILLCHGVNHGSLDEQVQINALSILDWSKLVTNRNNVKVIYLSTRLVYKGGGEYPVDVGSPILPLGSYAISKFFGECIVSSEFRRAVILRVPSVYDDAISAIGSNVISDNMGLVGIFMTQISQFNQLRTFEDGDFVRGFVSISNLINSIIILVKDMKLKAAIFNSPFESNISTHELAKFLSIMYVVPIVNMGKMPKSMLRFESGNMMWSDNSFMNKYENFKLITGKFDKLKE